MKLIKKIEQFRRDFTGLYECESCKKQVELKGYDDRNWHNKVVTEIKCPNCFNSTKSLRLAIEHVETKYPAALVV